MTSTRCRVLVISLATATISTTALTGHAEGDEPKVRAIAVLNASPIQLGAPRRVGNGTERRVAAFNVHLPSGVGQGPTHWYILRIHARLNVRHTGAPSQVSVLLNGHAGLQMLAAQDSSGGAPLLNELDLIRGETVIHPTQTTVSWDEMNYAQIAGLRAGPGRIAIVLEGFGAAPILTDVTVLPGTGLYETNTGPPSVSVKMPKLVRLELGHTARIPVTVRDMGLGVRRTVLALSGGDGILRFSGPQSWRIGVVATGQQSARTVTVRAIKTGVTPLKASGQTSAGPLEGETQIEVFSYRGSRFASLLASAALVVIIAAAAWIGLKGIGRPLRS